MRTQQEMQALAALIEPELRRVGVKVDGPEADANAQAIVTYLDTHPGLPISAESVKTVIHAMKDTFAMDVQKSAVRLKCEEIFHALPREKAQAFNAWYQQSGLEQVGEQAYKNILALLQWVGEKPFNGPKLTEAIYAIGKVPRSLELLIASLTWAKPPKSTEPQKIKGGKVNHAAEEVSPDPERFVPGFVKEAKKYWGERPASNDPDHARVETLLKNWSAPHEGRQLQEQNQKDIAAGLSAREQAANLQKLIRGFQLCR